MLLELRGDWKWHRESMRYVPGWSSTNICHSCKAPSRAALSCLICIYRRNDAMIRHCMCTTYIYAHMMTTLSLILYICVCVHINIYIYTYVGMHILFCYSMSYFGKLSVYFIIRIHLLSICPYLQDVHQLAAAGSGV